MALGPTRAVWVLFHPHLVPPNPCGQSGGLAPVSLLQWMATSKGSRKCTRLGVLCALAPQDPRSGCLCLRMEGGHFLSPFWDWEWEVDGRKPLMWKLVDLTRVPGASSGLWAEASTEEDQRECGDHQTCVVRPG